MFLSSFQAKNTKFVALVFFRWCSGQRDLVNPYMDVVDNFTVQRPKKTIKVRARTTSLMRHEPIICQNSLQCIKKASARN